jgi:hypothetical protein
MRVHCFVSRWWRRVILASVQLKKSLAAVRKLEKKLGLTPRASGTGWFVFSRRIASGWRIFYWFGGFIVIDFRASQSTAKLSNKTAKNALERHLLRSAHQLKSAWAKCKGDKKNCRDSIRAHVHHHHLVPAAAAVKKANAPKKAVATRVKRPGKKGGKRAGKKTKKAAPRFRAPAEVQAARADIQTAKSRLASAKFTVTHAKRQFRKARQHLQRVTVRISIIHLWV